ncbi:ArsR/SmtB family transcription factor [Clostridium vincentii]|uniref:HTH-type transcriptional repressor AseR n=1 Tax=Clostridium vincentii TaxID=52704 RepID=A0A2T0B990_9CLOT|nr:metalloregulator ArsR/SmtB family transcription factor [Clostridium vincentii]PRR80458.1 HTH-type transcriptional repressor AseR [Clostridium vincentii]
MYKVTNLFKVLSDETRLRILILLYKKELCVCQLQGILEEESQPKISKHLAKLRDLGFVKDERKEKFIYYYLNDNEMLKDILKSIIDNSNEYEVIKDDLGRLKYADEIKERKMNQVKNEEK